MTESQIWREVDRILNKKHTLRFSLSRSRDASEIVWHAVFHAEKGRVISRARAGERLAAIEEAVKKYLEKGE